MQYELFSSPVPEAAKQDEKIESRWDWVERSVWTDKMLITLEKGVKGGKWFSLIDKVYKMENLYSAYERVAKNEGGCGIDYVSIEKFGKRLDENIKSLHEQLKSGKYKPQAIRRTWIPKPGSKEKRPLGIPTVRDRVVQAAMRNVIEPIFEHEFSKNSFGFRPGKGTKDALRRVDSQLKDGFCHVVDADLKGYFDSIPHEIIMERLEEKISDGRVLDIIRSFLNQPIKEGKEITKPEKGTPQGAVISPLLSNMVLSPLDKLFENLQEEMEMTRYADDFVILTKSKESATNALEKVQDWTSITGLKLHPDKTHTVDMKSGGYFDFLGYRFEAGKRWPKDKSIRKFKETIRNKTKKNNPATLEMIIDNLNMTLRGWFEYYKHSNKYKLNMFDGFVRRRLRSLLRKRNKKKGGTGRCLNDHKRWPKSFFQEHGLFSLEVARVEAISPRNG